MRPDCEYAVATEHTATSKEAAILPVRQAKLRSVQCILTIHPTRKAISEKRCIYAVAKVLILLRILTHTTGNELRAIAIEEVCSMISIVHNFEAHLWCLLPFP